MKLLAYIFLYLFVAETIIDCNTVYSLRIPKAIWNVVKLASIAALLPAVFPFIKRNQVSSKRCLIWGVCYVLLAIMMFLLMKADFYSNFIYHFVLFLPLFVLYFSFAEEKYKMVFFKIFSEEMAVVGLLSLVLWYLGPLTHTIYPTGLTYIPWGEGFFIDHYYGLQFETQYMVMFGHEILRNSGFFAEAPMFNFCLCSALFCEVFLVPQKRLLVVGILLVTIFTTFTTMGMLVLGGIFVVFAVQKIAKSKNMIVLFLGYLSMPLLIGGLLLMSLLLMKDKSDSRSYAGRSGGIQYGISMFLKSPIWGNGYCKSMQGVGSNSIFLLLADGGILLCSFYYIPLFYFPLKNRKRNKPEFYFSLFYVFLFSLTMIAYSNISLVFVAYFYAGYLKKKKNIGYEHGSNEQNLLR